MHGITRCPNCKTAFKVAHHHLMPANGHVRCGKCKHDFNADEHWLVAEYAAYEAQISTLDAELTEPTQNTPNSLIYTLLLIGVLGLFLQYAWAYPGRMIARFPISQPLYEQSFEWLGTTDKSLVDLNDMQLQHFVARLSQQQNIRFDGLIKNNSPTHQHAPSLVIKLTLQDGTVLQKVIDSQSIHWQTNPLRQKQTTSFHFWIKNNQLQVIDYNASLCCQPKN